MIHSLRWVCFLFSAVYCRCTDLLHAITVICWLSTHCNACFLFALQSIIPVNPKKEKDLLLLPHFRWIHCLQNKKESTFCCLKWEISWFWRWSFAPTFKLIGSVTCSVKTHTLESALKFGHFFSKILNSNAWIGFYCTIDIDLIDKIMFSVV